MIRTGFVGCLGSGFSGSRLGRLRSAPGGLGPVHNKTPQNRRLACTPQALLVPASRVAIALAVHAGLLGVGWKYGERFLTKAGVAHACALGLLLWCSMGFSGWSLAATFFIIGNLATKVGKEIKEKEGTSEKRGGARGPENVWGAAGPAAICALVTLLSPALFSGQAVGLVALFGQLGYASAVATKTFDTLSSEIGKAYGKTTIRVTNFEVVPRGTEGAVSLEGTLAGLAGAVLISVFAWYAFLIPYLDIPVCIVAAFLANWVEGIVGSSFQEKMGLTNEAVNVINTGSGVVFAISIRVLLTMLNVFY
ncbi:hypothetical protein NDN08_003395 [Rhodosorus marinus]|uniref:TIGR00297 family protein n=1 Tax=Rhodosorus marinus TaxID=101924 RepID=A0AAV8V2B2_9RHOD|nr:hypothetical protein NDN08_003395 [Rhodosorus marinus]